jgi:hypothetical protein
MTEMMTAMTHPPTLDNPKYDKRSFHQGMNMYTILSINKFPPNLKFRRHKFGVSPHKNFQAKRVQMKRFHFKTPWKKVDQMKKTFHFKNRTKKTLKM